MARTLTWVILFCSFFSFSLSYRDDICGVYLAESTIPGAGLGMFVGHSQFEIGDVITGSDIMVPTFEIDWHNGHQSYPFLWDEYAWSYTMFPGMEQEIDNPSSLHVTSEGMGAAVNCRLNLVNTEDKPGTFQIGMSGVSSESPGAGAFTPYYGRSFHATKQIPAGMEIYADYGNRYFASRDIYKTVPLKQSYHDADLLLREFLKLRKRVNVLHDFQGPVTLGLYDLMLNFKLESRVFYAIPPNLSQVPAVVRSGGTKWQYYNESLRDLDWLRTHGKCMDHLKDGVSKIPDAGRGAFANRPIFQGQLVAPLPLIHVGNRSVLTMYDALPEEKGKIKRNIHRPTHQQLLLNYCFGHGESSLLLCPYGAFAGLINHNSSEANVKLVWSDYQRHPGWMNVSHRNWQEEKHSGLMLELVALRDINEDEEILLDYGNEWDTAWKKHKESFDTPRRNYIPAFERNKMLDIQIPTRDEVDLEAEGIYTYCRNTFVRQALGYTSRHNESIGIDPAVHDREEPCYRCHVMQRNHNNSYVAELVHRESPVDHPSGMWEVQKDTFHSILFVLPRDAFYFEDVPYKRDHYQHWSFRHHIGIPDEIFPEVWKDRKGVNATLPTNMIIEEKSEL